MIYHYMGLKWLKMANLGVVEGNLGMINTGKDEINMSEYVIKTPEKWVRVGIGEELKGE